MGWRDDPVIESKAPWESDPEVGSPPTGLADYAKQPRTFTQAELLAGSPAVRFAMGAASPFLGAAQLGAEAAGNKDVTAHLQRVEEMKQAGMTLAADLQRLKEGREKMAAMPGYEAAVANVDRQIVAIEQELAKLQAQGREDTAGFDVAGTAGAVVSPAFLGAAKALPAAATLTGRMAQGAALGGVAGLTAPVVNEDDFASAKTLQMLVGTLGGAVVPIFTTLAAKGGKAVYRALIEPLVNPDAIKQRAFLEAAGDKADDIVKLLRENKELVPGAKPTAGEAAVPAGRAEFAGLQRAAEKELPSAYLARVDEQNAARLAAIRTVGKTPADLRAAEAARSAAASKAYGAVAEDVLPVADTLKTLLHRPTMAKALETARTLAQESGRKLDLSKLTVRDAQTLKVALDDLIDPANTASGLGNAERTAAIKTRSDFFAWLGNKAPGWAQAREAFAAASRPINQMQVGQELEQKLTNAVSDEARQRAGVYAQALRDAPRTLKRATGQPRFQELSEILTPEQLRVVESVKADLARGVRFDEMAKRGFGAAGTSDLATRAMDQALGGKLPGMLQRAVLVTNSLISRMQGKIDQKLAAEIAAEMLNPPQVAESLARAAQRARYNQALAQRTHELLTAGTAGGIHAGARQ